MELGEERGKKPNSKECTLNYAEYASLALAGYAKLTENEPIDPNLLQQLGMIESEAAHCANNWKVRIQQHDPATRLVTTLFEHRQHRRCCLALTWLGMQDMLADPNALVPNSKPLFHYLKNLVENWTHNTTLPQGVDVTGHYLTGHLAVMLKQWFPSHIDSAYSFFGDEISKVSGLPERGVLATETHQTFLNLRCLVPASSNETPTVQRIGEEPLRQAAVGETKIIQEGEEDVMKRLAALLVALELMAGCATAGKMELDAEIDRRCAVDGGIKVYETVQLPPEQFEQSGDPIFFRPSKGEDGLGPDYVYKSETTWLNPGGEQVVPRAWRTHDQVFRRADGKLLGESVYYGRYGGYPRWLLKLLNAHDTSHYNCPKGSIDVVGKIFIKKSGGAQ
jgi:hypothetical protein